MVSNDPPRGTRRHPSVSKSPAVVRGSTPVVLSSSSTRGNKMNQSKNTKSSLPIIGNESSRNCSDFLSLGFGPSTTCTITDYSVIPLQPSEEENSGLLMQSITKHPSLGEETGSNIAEETTNENNQGNFTQEVTPSSNQRKRSRTIFAEEVNNYGIGLVPESYPENSLTKAEVELLAEQIMGKIDALTSERGQFIKFKGYSHRRGSLYLTCATEETKAWVEAIVPDLRLGRTKIRVVEEDNLERHVRARGYITGTKDSLTHKLILDRICNQNSDVLPVSKWSIAEIKHDKNGAWVVFRIPESSIPLLRRQNYQVYYRLRTFTLRVFLSSKKLKAIQDVELPSTSRAEEGTPAAGEIALTAMKGPRRYSLLHKPPNQGRGRRQRRPQDRDDTGLESGIHSLGALWKDDCPQRARSVLPERNDRGFGRPCDMPSVGMLRKERSPQRLRSFPLERDDREHRRSGGSLSDRGLRRDHSPLRITSVFNERNSPQEEIRYREEFRQREEHRYREKYRRREEDRRREEYRRREEDMEWSSRPSTSHSTFTNRYDAPSRRHPSPPSPSSYEHDWL